MGIIAIMYLLSLISRFCGCDFKANFRQNVYYLEFNPIHDTKSWYKNLYCKDFCVWLFCNSPLKKSYIKSMISHVNCTLSIIGLKIIIWYLTIFHLILIIFNNIFNYRLALKHYETNLVSNGHQFTIPVDTSSVRPAIAKLVYYILIPIILTIF